jgi:hypothetical protein
VPKQFRPPPGLGRIGAPPPSARGRAPVPRRPPPGNPPRGVLGRVPGNVAPGQRGSKGGGIADSIRAALGEAQLKLMASKVKLEASVAALRATLGSQ